MKRWALLGILAALMAAPPAAAAPGDELTCTFEASGLVDPSIPPGLNGFSMFGTYAVNGRANCQGTMGGTPVVPSPTGSNASISWAGNYDNLSCGTGWAWDAGANLVSLDSGPAVTGVDYEITFAAMKGAIRIGVGPWTAPSAPPGNLGGSWDGGGVTELTPRDGDCVNSPIRQFDLTGTFTIRDGPPNPSNVIDQVNQVVADPASAVLGPGTGEPSALCTAPTVPVIDTTVQGIQLRLLVQQNGTTSTWVCVRVAGAGTYLGGRLVVEAPTPGGGGLPSTDASSTACSTTPGNQIPGTHPMAGPGTIGGVHHMIDAWASGTEAWVCVELGTEKHRLKIQVPGVSGGGVRFEHDD